MARSRPRFGALVEAQGLYLVEYRLAGGGIDILRHVDEPVRVPAASVAARRLAELLEAEGGRGAHVAVAVRGFGICHHMLTLPPAPPELLRPIVEREMSRLYPDIDDPIVDFVPGGTVERRATGQLDNVPPQQEIFAAIAPRALVRVFEEELASRRIVLGHLTAAPQALQRLVREVDAGHAPTGTITLLPGGPLLEFFHDGALRLVVEPPASPDQRAGTDLDTVIGQVDRGRLYLRQQFRGARVDRLLLGAQASERERLAGALGARLGSVVEPLAPDVGPPGALVALGAVLDAESEPHINLSPTARAAGGGPDRSTVRVAVAGVGSVIAAALLWAVLGLNAVTHAEQELQSRRGEAARRLAPVLAMRETAGARRAHAASVALLEQLRGERARLQETLRAVALAAPEAIRLTEATMEVTASDWQTVLVGTASGPTSAEAVEALDAFYRQLATRIPSRDMALQQLDYAPNATGAGDVEIRFRVMLVATGAPSAGAPGAAGGTR